MKSLLSISLFASIALSQNIYPTRNLSLPVILRADNQLVSSSLSLVVKAEIINSPIAAWANQSTQGPSRQIAEFLRDLMQVDGAASAVTMVARAETGETSRLKPLELVDLYREFLPQGSLVRILLSKPSQGGTIFFWQAISAKQPKGQINATLVRARGTSYSISEPMGDDHVTYLMLRSLSASATAGTLLALLAGGQTVDGTTIVETSISGVSLAVQVRAYETRIRDCTTQTVSNPLAFVACWMNKFPESNSSLSTISRQTAERWISTLPKSSLQTLVPRSPPDAVVTGYVVDAGKLSIVFPSVSSALQGNKRGIYVSCDKDECHIVNFFRADFVDPLVDSAIARLEASARQTPQN